LLGSDDEAARFRAYQPFAREIAAESFVTGSFDDSLAAAGVPAAAMLEAQHALAAAIDLDRDVHTGDRFYVRYEQTFTAEGAPIGVGRLLWAELRTKAKGTVAVHRFRQHDKTERFWLANGQSATLPSMRLPLETVSISSGFGLRADPFDQPPPRPVVAAKSVPMGGPKHNLTLPPGLPVGGVSGNGATKAALNVATPLGAALGLVPYGSWQAAPHVGPHLAPQLFMHEGVDFAAPTGTPVYAAADGVVVDAAPNGGYGNWIRIDHSSKLSTVYGHLLAFAPGIEPGESVVRGELIGFVGNTGRSTGPHLHFEIRSDGKPVNPITYPELKPGPLHGPDLERFRKQVARSLEEREREAKLALALAGI
jgi:murein DD-endopeptidase MepM/ murein hydrolase activator NlpD